MAASDSPIRIDVAPSASAAAAHIELLLGRLDGAATPEERAAILLEVGVALRDDLGDQAQAIEALFESWRNDPANEKVLDELEPLLRAHDRFRDALENARTLFGSERDRKRALLYAETIVRWLTREVPDAELARQWVERIRVLDATHPLVHMVQAAAAREMGDFRREIEELDRAVLSTRRADERATIHLLLASRYREERTKNRAEAKKQYAAAHKLFPKKMDALRGLEELALEENDKRALADVLRKQAEADVEPAAKIDILLRLAKLEEEEFRKPDLAGKTLEQVLQIDPHHNGALDALERCYRAARMWPELAALLERAAVTDAEPEVQAGRLQRLGDVFESKLSNVNAALEAYQRLAGLMPENEIVVGELARLAEKTNDVTLAVNCRERLAEIAKDPLVRARNHVVAGQLLTPTDPAGARRHFEAAVRYDGTNQVAWNALLLGARAENDLARASRYLEERAKKMETPRAKASAWVELAEVRAKMGDTKGQRRALEEAAAADPTNEIAAEALLYAFVEEKRFAEAVPLADTVAAAAERDKDKERIFLARRAQGQIAIALDMPDLALGAALAAHVARPEDLEAKEVLVRAAGALGADPLVATARDALVAIADAPDGLSLDTRVVLGDVLMIVGEGERAAVLYDGVVREKPDHERALAGLSLHHAASGNKIASLSLKRQIALGVSDEAERVAALLEVAEEMAKAESWDAAAEVYEDVRKLRPSELPILHKLLAVYQKLSRWTAIMDVLQAITKVDTDPLRRSKTFYTMAQIARDELLDRGAALSLFDQALEADPSQLEAFEKIVRMLTESKDWLGLEQMYKRMIARAAGRNDAVLSHALHKQLGLVYRDRIGDMKAAIAEFQAGAAIRPEDEEIQTMLRELLARTGQASGAVAITLDRVLREPMDPTPYAALFELLMQQNQRDRALCVASAMRFLGIAHPAATGFRTSYPQPPIDAIVLDLGPEGYRELLHPDLDPALTQILEVVAPAVVDITVSQLPVRERLGHPGPVLKGHDWLARSVARAAQILGHPPPRLYQRRIPGAALGAAATKPASLLVYPPALGGIGADVIAFVIGKRVMELTPPLLARALCPSITELKALAASAARIATNQAEPGDQALRERLRREDVMRISAAVDDAMARTKKLDVLRWSQLADLSTSRAGLLLAGDVEAARAALAIEPQAPSDLAPREKMKELVAWFLGDQSAQLRRRLGIALK